MAVATAMTRKAEQGSAILHHVLMILAGAGILALAGQLRFILPIPPCPSRPRPWPCWCWRPLGPGSRTASVARTCWPGGRAPIFTVGGGLNCLVGLTGGYLMGLPPGRVADRHLSQLPSRSSGLTRAIACSRSWHWRRDHLRHGPGLAGLLQTADHARSGGRPGPLPARRDGQTCLRHPDPDPPPPLNLGAMLALLQACLPRRTTRHACRNAGMAPFTRHTLSYGRASARRRAMEADFRELAALARQA